MSEILSELLEWVKLPIDLQHGFFELAAREADELSEVIRSINESIGRLKADIFQHFRTVPEQTKKSIVAAVDSSRSPRLSERLGIKYGVYATGVVYLRGSERWEKFEPGIFRCRQALSRENSKHLFDLITIQHERKVAKKALKECNLLFIDGSFYSFIFPALEIKKRGRLEKREREILEDVFNLTEELRESRKVIGVVKRSRSRVLGGWMLLEKNRSEFINILDKHIFSLIMPEKSYFEYSSIVGERHPAIYTRVAYIASLWEGFIDKLLQGSLTKSALIREAERGIYFPFEDLGLLKDGFERMRRAQVRFYGGVPPCELEYPDAVDLREALSEEDLFNEVTNLPLALDLVDSLVNISSKFTEEFVSEIEGRVLEKIATDHENIEAIRAFFTFLNPQKPF
ncbi:MAG: DNA double-strand break repair nuclease NurA [Candidatus Bathyarchaeia archaeon]|nr:DNA double-strand break repair nuclease NurA [Candidatus Bathyarchaeota archaeon]